ncbi:MAG: hypothetical protein ACYDDA_13545 [Acidiferrobacteraceae bacterium]
MLICPTTVICSCADCTTLSGGCNPDCVATVTVQVPTAVGLTAYVVVLPGAEISSVATLMFATEQLEAVYRSRRAHVVAVARLGEVALLNQQIRLGNRQGHLNESALPAA